MEEEMPGIKFLIVGKEAMGKTHLAGQIKDSLLVATDNKAFQGNVPHFRYAEYNGLDDFIETLEEKIGLYEEKYGKLPKTITIDRVTHLANAMEKYANDKFTGFNVWSNLGKDINNLNNYFETILIPNGFNVVLTAHCVWNADIARYEIPAHGNFAKNGSWLSVTDNSIFLDAKGNKRIVYLNSIKVPARTTLKDLPEVKNAEEYDINEHIKELTKHVKNTDKFIL
jgi:hypothetical protein